MSWKFDETMTKGSRAVYIQLEGQEERAQTCGKRRRQRWKRQVTSHIARHGEGENHSCSRPGLKRAAQITCCKQMSNARHKSHADPRHFLMVPTSSAWGSAPLCPAVLRHCLQLPRGGGWAFTEHATQTKPQTNNGMQCCPPSHANFFYAPCLQSWRIPASIVRSDFEALQLVCSWLSSRRLQANQLTRGILSSSQLS